MKEFYLDTAATVPVTKQVATRMKKVMQEEYGNPSSKHEKGEHAKNIVETSRKEIAEYIGAKTNEIIFTSGATESNNLAIQGILKANPDKRHILTTKIEHASILDLCKALEDEGCEIDYVTPNKDGIVEVEKVAQKIRSDTLLVTIMYVNNEIGTIQPIKEIAKACKERGILFHTDAVQSLQKLPIDVKKLGVDLLSISGHKVGGPKGIGALYVKEGVRIAPLIIGGGQEQNKRSGTLNTPGIAGFAEALKEKMPVEKITKTRNMLMEKLLAIPGTKINGSVTDRVCNNINISFEGISAEALLLRLSEEGIYVSTGSACASTKMGVSHVLKAINVEQKYIHGSIRITIGVLHEKEILYITQTIEKHVRELRNLSPRTVN